MEKNHKGQSIIHSIEELRPSQRNQVKRAAIGIGFLMVLIFGLLLLLFDISPAYKSSLFEGNIQLILLLASGVTAFDLGYKLGFYMKVADLGYALVSHPSADYYRSPNQAFSSSDSPRHSYSSFHSSSVSINPASGRSMSGSSGVDTSGNPYGTRSW